MKLPAVAIAAAFAGGIFAWPACSAATFEQPPFFWGDFTPESNRSVDCLGHLAPLPTALANRDFVALRVGCLGNRCGIDRHTTASAQPHRATARRERNPAKGSATLVRHAARGTRADGLGTRLPPRPFQRRSRRFAAAARQCWSRPKAARSLSTAEAHSRVFAAERSISARIPAKTPSPRICGPAALNVSMPLRSRTRTRAPSAA
jgi:hypothetical protein